MRIVAFVISVLVSRCKDNEIIDKYLLIIHFSSKALARVHKKKRRTFVLLFCTPSGGVMYLVLCAYNAYFATLVLYRFNTFVAFCRNGQRGILNLQDFYYLFIYFWNIFECNSKLGSVIMSCSRIKVYIQTTFLNSINKFIHIYTL